MQLALFILAALAYGAAIFAFGVEPAASENSGRLRRLPPRLVLAAAAALHLGFIGSQCFEGFHPLRSIFLSVDLGTLLAVVGYVLLDRGGRLDGVGGVFGAVGLVGLVLGVTFGDHGVARLPGQRALASAHVLLATAGVAGFTVAAGVAGVYLGMERRLRAKAFRPGGRGMSLAGLDRLQHRLILLVTPIFTLAIVTGVLWLLDAGDPGAVGEQLAGRGVELVLAGAAWLASVFILVARAAWGMRGRRSAWIALLSFVAVLLVLATYGLRV